MAKIEEVTRYVVEGMGEFKSMDEARAASYKADLLTALEKDHTIADVDIVMSALTTKETREAIAAYLRNS